MSKEILKEIQPPIIASVQRTIREEITITRKEILEFLRAHVPTSAALAAAPAAAVGIFAVASLSVQAPKADSATLPSSYNLEAHEELVAERQYEEEMERNAQTPDPALTRLTHSR